ncbi:MAG: two-component regulator propeller domain-containing protein [Bacteroidales bacterium]|jgi:signal transduction histidine kinase/ligand-binding sensor domain-containing protein/DNA-binding NarL/FixJ family response regulator|nr:two-component regulator propeller domain-containing protein [Bacteroidales bacterium]
MMKSQYLSRLKNKILHSGLLLMLFVGHFAFGQKAENFWQVRQIANADGLSNSAVNSIFKDSRGFMWFGTWDGLNQYDGKNIVQHYPDMLLPNRLSNNIIWKMLEDSSNGLWIVTERGINRYDYTTNRFQPWFVNNGPQYSRENSLRAALGVDGNTWLAIYSAGIFRFAPADADFIQLQIPNLPEDRQKTVIGLYSFANQMYLLHDDFQVSVLNEKGSFVDQFSIYRKAAAENSSSTLNWFFELNDQAYLAMPCLDGGIRLINLITQKVELIQKDTFPSPVTALFADAENNNLLLGTDDGNLLKMAMDENYDIQSLTNNIPLLSDKKVKIWSILKTGEMLWIGTDGEGVFQANMQPKPFYNIGKGLPEGRQLNHKIVRAVYEDSKGNLWVGTRGGGLNKIPANGDPTQVYNTENGLSNDAVLSLAEDLHGNIWIGIDGQGIDVLNPKTAKVSHFPIDFPGAEKLDFSSVYTICVDVYGTVWLGTSGSGVYGLTLDYKNELYTLRNHQHLPGNGGQQDLRGNVVFAIREEKPNVLWIGARMAGLHRYNTLTREIQYFKQDSDTAAGLSNSDVLSLKIGTDKKLWVGTSGGLNVTNLLQPEIRFRHFSVPDGLPNHTIHSIIEDKQGDIWMSTNKGLSRYLKTESRFINYNRGDGLLNNEYTDGAAFHNTTVGKVYFGGINGIDWFYPQDIQISASNPDVLLTAFLLFNKKIEPGDESGILSESLDFTDEIRLSHDQNFFGVEFTTLNYNNAAKNNFAYKLENFNVDWIETGTQRTANFTNVPFGRYKLLIRATNEDGFWSDDIRSVSIIIRPPFYLTYAAFVVYSLLFLLLIYLIYRYQSNRIKKRHSLALEAFNRKKEKELNQYKFEFFTNLAHEFRTPLTLIFASAATLLEKIDVKHSQYAMIRNVYANARRLQHMTDELLAFQKLDTGREKIKLKSGDLVGFIEGIIEVFTHYATEKELELTFEPEESEILTAFDGDKIERILLNLLSNAIKYTPSGGAVAVRLKSNKTTVIIDIQDTGTGIPPNILPHIFERYFHYNPEGSDKIIAPKSSGIGLAYAHSLVALQKGKISVESKVNVGTTFTVSLPLIKADLKDKRQDTKSLLSLNERFRESIAEEFFQQQDYALEQNNSAANTARSNNKYRVLIVEDDLQLLQLLKELLSSHYEIITATNGQKALDMLKQKRIDLVVSDVMMPVMDGLELCRTIKEDVATSHIPVVLLTARAANEQLIEGLETGADSYITKPFHPKHLYLRIDKLLHIRELLSSGFKENIEKRSEEVEQHLSERDRKLLDKAFEFIGEKYFSEELNADKLADELALSKAQLYRKIKALTGLTPHGLIKHFRLNKAREMILEDKYSISDIVFMCGFNNRTYFYRSYKELFGEAPGELNKNR